MVRSLRRRLALPRRQAEHTGAPAPWSRPLAIRLAAFSAVVLVSGAALVSDLRIFRTPSHLAAEHDAGLPHNSVTGWTLSASKDCRLRRRNGVTPCLRDLLKFAEKHKRRVRAVQIGACDGNFTMEPGDAFQKLAFRAAHVDALLVEPVPFLFAKLEENLRPWQAVRRRPRGSLVAINGAVCAQEGAEKLPFYFAAPRFALDFPHAKHWMKYQLGRLLSDEAIVMKIVGHLVKMADLADLERVEEQEASKLQVLGVGGVDRNTLFHALKRNRTLRKAFKAFNWPPDLNLTALKEKARSQYVANISPVKIPQSTFLPAFHSYGLDFHSRFCDSA